MAPINDDEHERLRDLELRLAELVGVDGDGGQIANMESLMRLHSIEIKDNTTRIGGIELFQHRIRWTVATAVSIGTVVAIIAMKVVDHLLK